MNGNPGKNTTGFVEMPSGYVFKLHYGDKTTVTGEGKTLEEALIVALDKAQNYPPAARMQADRRQREREAAEAATVKLPGM
jgi:curli biogenesis system outer membrane secretion channel CsgG